MRLRAVHFASFLLLLATLSAAEGSLLRESSSTLTAQYIGILLGRSEAAAAPQTTSRRAADTLALALPAASIAQYRTVWDVRAPSRHTASLHAVTGSAA